MNASRVESKLREICRRLPEVRETVKWGHPTFEAGKKMFAVLDQYQDRLCIAFRAELDHVDTLLSDERFFAAPYAARHGWVCLYADGRLNWTEIETLVVASYRLVALKRMLAALEASPRAKRK
jgi:predicted DNA-binding protein (MmcQ/YjbR family)